VKSWLPLNEADTGGAVRMLSELLHQKGILTQSEMARVNGPGHAPVVPRCFASFRPCWKPPFPQPLRRRPSRNLRGPKQESPVPPVTSAARFPVQLYGTILWNAFYNTAGTNIEDIPLLATKRGTDSLREFSV